MASLYFCDPTQLYKFTPRRSVDYPNSPESDSDNIIIRLQDAAKPIVNTGFLSSTSDIILPSSRPDPVTNNWLLLENLNLINAIPPIFKTIALAIDSKYIKYSNSLKKLAALRIQQWRKQELLAGFYQALLGNPLPTTALADVASCCLYTPGFTPISEDDEDTEGNNLPYIETIEDFILRESAYLYVKLETKGYNITNLTEDQEQIYSDIVGLFVGAFILGIRSIVNDNEGYNADIDSECANLINEGIEKIQNLDSEDLCTKLLRE